MDIVAEVKKVEEDAKELIARAEADGRRLLQEVEAKKRKELDGIRIWAQEEEKRILKKARADGDETVKGLIEDHKKQMAKMEKRIRSHRTRIEKIVLESILRWPSQR